MHPATLRRLTGALLIAVPLAFTLLFTFLQIQFEYPDILRQPTSVVLTKFQAGGAGLVAAWYGLTLTAVLFIPLALLVRHMIAGESASFLPRLAATSGVIAGVAQTLGFLRWPFLVPFLAQTYLDPASSEAQRAAVAVVFEAFHRYAGMAIGEHLGYLSTAIWTFLFALALWRSPLFGRWYGSSGIALAFGIAAGMLEPAGVPWVGAINAVSYLVWALWLIALGVSLLARPSRND